MVRVRKKCIDTFLKIFDISKGSKYIKKIEEEDGTKYCICDYNDMYDCKLNSSFGEEGSEPTLMYFKKVGDDYVLLNNFSEWNIEKKCYENHVMDPEYPFRVKIDEHAKKSREFLLKFSEKYFGFPVKKSSLLCDYVNEALNLENIYVEDL